jgi:hypothetical protein
MALADRLTSPALPAPPFTPRARAVVLGLAALYAAVIIPTAIHRSTDLQSHLALANRLLDGLRVYEPQPQFGTWWPPGALVLLTPLALLARLSLAAAKGVFAAFGVACVVWLVVRAPTTRWIVVALAVAAVCGPLQKDFENLNLNVVLLTLILAATRDLAAGKDTRAGVWLGLATAAKVFPALFIAYAVYRRRWRTALWAAGLAAAITLLPLLGGLDVARETFGDWIERTQTGTAALRGQTHALADVIVRVGAPHAAGVAVTVLLFAGAAWWLRRRRPLVVEMAMITHVALLTTPLVWAQNFVLLYLTWLVLLDTPPPVLSAPTRRWLYPPLGFVTSGILTSWSRPVRVAMYRAAVYTWGAVATLALLALVPPLGDRPPASVD